MDSLSKKRRSEIMSRIRSKHSVPELKVRSLIHRQGYRFRLHSKTLPGKPDLVFVGRKKIIFVHGCFWHSHSGCPKGRPPKSNLEFWLKKLEANKRRDAQARRKLRSQGWRVLTVWQCQLKHADSLMNRIVAFLETDTQSSVSAKYGK
jgi:DNA mismatch endonuclease (patch repair protein)